MWAPSFARLSLRELLEHVLITAADFDAFCLDCFPQIYRRYSSAMDRPSRTNLLLELIPPAALLQQLRTHAPKSFAQYEDRLQPELSQASQMQHLDDQLDALLIKKESLLGSGLDTAEVDAEVLSVRRLQRQGPQLQSGELLGQRYKLLKLIGRGGLANVWQAHDRQRKQLVAVKVLHGQWGQDQSMLDRLTRGARRMAQLSHPNVIRVLSEVIEDHGFHFFVMEYAPGGDLRSAVRDQAVSRSEALAMVLQAGAALHNTHQSGLIHRDVKPANILIDDKRQARLSDFDLVLAKDTTGGTRTGALGTFLYAAPEAMEDARLVDCTADVYSLGMTALFSIYGKDLPVRVLENRTLFIDALTCSDGVKLVLKRAIAWEPIDRYPTVGEFCQALSDAIQNKSSSQSDPGPSHPSADRIANTSSDWVKDLATSVRSHIESKLQLADTFVIPADIAIPPLAGYLQIRFGGHLMTGQQIFVNVNAFPNLQLLLNSLFPYYLADVYEPYTYGRDWVLVEEHSKRMAIDWKWLTKSGIDEYKFDREWSSSVSLEECGLLPATTWNISPVLRPAYGVAVNDPDLFSKLKGDARAIESLLRQGFISATEVSKSTIDKYRYLGLFELTIFDFGIGEGYLLIQPASDSDPICQK